MYNTLPQKPSPEPRSSLPKDFMLHEYRIESVLGKPGGFGITYLATDTNLQLSVAIKEYLPSDFAIREGISTVYVKSSSDEESFQWGLNCFTDEARILAHFSHPNIVRILRFFELNGTAYMVMEYHDGACLTEHLKKGSIPEDDLMGIILPLLDGLEKIHAAGYLHRDIKPNNIYVRKDNTPILLDFGSARYAIGQKTRTVTSIVSPGYAPLEQYDNENSAQGPWTDIYALGAVMYYAISGEPPHAATRRVTKDAMIPAVQIGKGKYRKGLLTAIDWALEINEDKRPQTIEKWREQLLIDVMPPKEVEIPLTHRLTQRITPRKLATDSRLSFLMMTGVVVFLLFIATVGVLIYQNQILVKEQASRYEAEQELKDVKIALERAEDDFAILKKRYDLEKDEHGKANNIIKQIQHYEVIAGGESTDNALKTQTVAYYNIVNVRINDTLNVREFPHPKSGILTEIPADELCVPFLNRIHLLKGRVWAMVAHNNITGWVNTYFLKRNNNCPLKKDTLTAPAIENITSEPIQENTETK